MDNFILTLGWVGVYAPLALGAVGSMMGVRSEEHTSELQSPM